MSIDQIKEAGKKMALRLGITGGFMAFHPYRITDRIKMRLSYHCRGAYRLNEDDRERKFWELIKADALQLGDWRLYVEWGPHYHYIGFGRLPKNPYPKGTPAAREWAETKFAGWVPRWIRHVDTKVYFNGQDMVDPVAELASYILSHTAYVKDKKSVKWFGCCTPGRLKKCGKPDKQSYEVVCPKCGSPVILGDLDMQKKFVPRLDQDGAVVNYRLRYHWQKYEIVHKTDARPRRISAKASAIWGPAGPPVNLGNGLESGV